MSERKYSVVEIALMRESLTLLLTPMDRSFRPGEVAAQVEDQLRTYMQNGTEPEDLEKHAREILSLTQQLRMRVYGNSQ